MRTYDAVIFDLDGTLLNTLEDLTDAVNAVMRAHGFQTRSMEEVRSFVGNGVRRLMELVVPETVTGEAFEAVMEEYRSYYTQHCQNKTGAYEGILPLLETLREKGYALAIVSNKNEEAVCELNRLYFQELIKTAIGQREGIRRKPAPDTVLQALQELGIPKERAVYVGDSEVDFATANNCGMDCVLVSWGFRTEKELAKLTPKARIARPEQLLDVLE